MLECSIQSQMKLKPGKGTEKNDRDKFQLSIKTSYTDQEYL